VKAPPRAFWIASHPWAVPVLPSALRAPWLPLRCPCHVTRESVDGGETPACVSSPCLEPRVGGVMAAVGEPQMGGGSWNAEASAAGSGAVRYGGLDASGGVDDI
jgi:hypothetical protein